MASTAAMVFFWRPGRMSRRALLTGFLIGAGGIGAGLVGAGVIGAGVVGAGVIGADVVCAIADAASNSKAGITRGFFIFLFSL